MKTSDFDYELPPALIAQQPPAERTQARMMVLNRHARTIEHRGIAELSDFLSPLDLLVVNDTRVIPARIFGCKEDTGGRVELFLLEELQPDLWETLYRASRPPKQGTTVALGSGRLRACVERVLGEGRVHVRLSADGPVADTLAEEGIPPLPPYIKRPQPEPRELLALDRERYQTVYATHPGAVAAPTAGLHFTPELLATLDSGGIRRASVTLHVGIGTFRPVKVDNVEEHEMEAERYVVPDRTAELVALTRGRADGRVVAVGTTTVRTLETAAAEHGSVVPCSGRSTLFIYPPYEFRVVNVLLTNFHLPRSTLLMMICAFASREFVLEAYLEAVRRQYRFYSYGDCMLIL